MAKRVETSRVGKVIECLMDEDRTRAFNRAISKVVRPGDTVLDCGAGTGIMSIIAARAGGKAVALEKDRIMSEIAQNNIKSSGYAERISVHCKDVVLHKSSMDVVIMSSFDTCLVGDDTARVVNALVGKAVITPRTKTIPFKCCNFFELVNYDFDFQDAYMPMVVQTGKERCVDVLSASTMFGEVDFGHRIDPQVKYMGRHVITCKGWLNAIKFSTVTHMTEDTMIGATSHLNVPIYVPVHEMCVKPGDVVSVEIAYTMGCSLSGLQVNVI